MILSIQNHDVLVDKDVVEILEGFNHPDYSSRRKHRLPLKINSKGYVRWQGRLNKKQKAIPLHHLILGVPLDHINRNPLDNRRCNLRIVSQRENCHNKSNNNPRVGVNYRRDKKCYVSRIWVDGKERHLGSFKCKHMALDLVRRGY